MCVCAMSMPCVERMKPQHVKSLILQVWLHYLGNVPVVAKGHVNVFQATMRFIDAVLGLVFRYVPIGVILEILRKYNLICPGTAHWKGVSYYSPLGFAVQAETLAQIMNEAHQNHPSRLAVTTHRLRRLQKVF